MTIDKAFETAIAQLNERGELLNLDLYRLVALDKERFRQLRKSLIEQGFAEDQSGTGLKATERTSQKGSDTRSDSDDQRSDTKLPNDALLSVPSDEENEFDPSISFTEADFLPLRCEKPKVTPPPSSVSQSQPRLEEPDDAPALVSLDLASDSRQFVSQLAANKWKLLAMVLVAIPLAITNFPWRNSPDAHSVYQEFKQYYDQANDLRTRAVSDPGEWQHAMSQSRSRVQSIVKALKDVRTGASAQHPEKQELLWAGNESLLMLLENREINRNEEKKLQKEFEYHMSEARRLIDGGTRTVPEKRIAPKDSPGAGKPYLGKK